MNILKEHGVWLALGAGIGWYLAKNGGLKGAAAKVKAAG